MIESEIRPLVKPDSANFGAVNCVNYLQFVVIIANIFEIMNLKNTLKMQYLSLKLDAMRDLKNCQQFLLKVLGNLSACDIHSLRCGWDLLL